MYSTYSTAKTGQPPIQGTTATYSWFHENGVIAFATTLDWNGVKGLHTGFSKSTCHNLGKVKDVIPKKESMVTAQKGESMVTAQKGESMVTAQKGESMVTAQKRESMATAQDIFLDRYVSIQQQSIYTLAHIYAIYT